MQKILTHQQLDNNLWLYEVQVDIIDNGFPSVADYSPYWGKFTPERVAVVTTDWELSRFAEFLGRRKAYIVHTVSHDPILGDGEDLVESGLIQRVKFDESDYVDMFGLYVYVGAELCWKHKEDVDLRFPGNVYPHHLLGDELKWMMENEYL